MAENRAKAYQDLWKMTEPFAYSKSESEFPKLEEQKEIKGKLVLWYYNEGNAMYLSLDATDLFLKCKEQLPGDEDEIEQTAIKDKSIKEIFSELRTQLKVDTGTYTQKDAQVKLPKTANKSLDVRAKQ